MDTVVSIRQIHDASGRIRHGQDAMLDPLNHHIMQHAFIGDDMGDHRQRQSVRFQQTLHGSPDPPSGNPQSLGRLDQAKGRGAEAIRPGDRPNAAKRLTRTVLATDRGQTGRPHSQSTRVVEMEEALNTLLMIDISDRFRIIGASQSGVQQFAFDAQQGHSRQGCVLLLLMKLFHIGEVFLVATPLLQPTGLQQAQRRDMKIAGRR